MIFKGKIEQRKQISDTFAKQSMLRVHRIIPKSISGASRYIKDLLSV
nr:MAG TPA: hypothetical protein [Bacteriophage sp.]